MGTTGQQLGFTTNSGLITRFVGIGGDTGFSPYAQATYTRFAFGTGGTWVMFDGQTRPLLQSEYATSINTAHQLQLVGTNLTASYTVADDIDLSPTAAAPTSGTRRRASCRSARMRPRSRGRSTGRTTLCRG